MKWILWSIWSIICIIALLTSMLIYSIIFLISFLWQFRKTDLVLWGDLHFTKHWDAGDAEDAEWELVEDPDKNPWATYKRWMFLDA